MGAGALHTSVHTHFCHTLQIFLEDAGFDWKVLGPDARQQDLDYVAWQCDQDAYACSGQKCSAQSIMFAHSNWVGLGLFDRMKELAGRCGAAPGPGGFGAQLLLCNKYHATLATHHSSHQFKLQQVHSYRCCLFM